MSRGSKAVSIACKIQDGETYKVISQELHDEGRVFVALLAESVELSNCIVESLLGEVASLVWRVEDLVVEHREVQSKAESDGMRGCEISLSNFGGILVCFKRLVRRPLSLLRNGKLSEVSVVVALPLRCQSYNRVLICNTYILW